VPEPGTGPSPVHHRRAPAGPAGRRPLDPPVVQRVRALRRRWPSRLRSGSGLATARARRRALRRIAVKETVRRIAWPTRDAPDQVAAREWLVTNGLGGYASGTVSTVVTRRY